MRFDDSMYVSVADDGSLNCWRNETGRARDASDHFDCANLLPLVSPQACDAPWDTPCNAPCNDPCNAHEMPHDMHRPVHRPSQL